MSKKQVKKTKKKQAAKKQPPVSQEEKLTKNLEIRFKTKITKLQTNKACAGMEHEAVKLTNEQNRLAFRWTKNKEPLRITIGGIETRAVMKKSETEASGDLFKYQGFDFTAEQYGKLAGMVKTEKKIEVIIEPDPENLFKDKKSDKDEVDEGPDLFDNESGPPVSN